MDSLSRQVQAALGTRYRVMGMAAKGGMSTVLRAIDLKHDRVVAVKVLHEEVAGLLGSERFHREIRLIARLQHPHIVPLFDSGEAAGLLYYTMPFVDGESLRDRLRLAAPLPIEEALRFTRELCDALGYAHAYGVLRRDVKPDNILIAGGHALLTDFGIARAIRVSTVSDVSLPGLVVGTPAYMSPEQAMGLRDLDERSDLYSLGCVVYEMLSGRLPYAGDTPQALLTDRFRSVPRPLRTLREEVPPNVERAVERALATDPEARFPSAAAFARELQPAAKPTPRTPVAATPTIGSAQTIEGASSRRWAAVAAGVLAVVVTLAGAVLWRARAASAESDALGPIAVLPLAHSSPSVGGFLSGDHCARLLYDALGRWEGLPLTDAMRVRDVLQRRPDGAWTLTEIRDIAQELGARLVVWGEVVATGDDLDVRVTVYRVARSLTPLHVAKAFVSAEEDPWSTISSLADELVRGLVPGVPSSERPGTRDVAALRAYVRGQAALDAWDVVAAESLFLAAVQKDTGYARAALSLAQVASWRSGDDVDRWRQWATHAASRPDRLTSGEHAHAEALVALASQDNPAACERYRRILARDSLSFAAWFGLGECQSRDQVVVKDARSRSGWRFRSSQHSAIAAYERAFELVPSFQRALSATAYVRLRRLLFAEANFVRQGVSQGDDSAWFAAFPELAADTLAFVPYPRELVFRAAPAATPPSRGTAVARNRRVLTRLAERWVRTSPMDAGAHEAYALALELEGSLVADSGSGGRVGALGALRRARQLARAPDAQVRLFAWQVRVHIKLGQFAAAAALADSLVNSPAALDAGDAQLLASVNALVGRTAESARWARRAAPAIAIDPATGTPRFPVAPAREAMALLVFAATGLDADSIRALLRRVEALIAASAPRAEVRGVREAMLDWPVTLAYPTVGASPLLRTPAGGNVHMEAAYALSRGDRPAALVALHQLEEMSAPGLPGDAGYDAIALETELLQLAGDTTAAETLATLTFNALAASGRQVGERVSESAAFPRFLLRWSELAAQRGDSTEARRRARLLAELTPRATGATAAARNRLLTNLGIR
jgi:hypothetical protein